MITTKKLMTSIKLPIVTKPMGIFLIVLWAPLLFLAFSGTGGAITLAAVTTLLVAGSSLLIRAARYHSTAHVRTEKLFRQYVGSTQFFDVAVGKDKNFDAAGTGIAYDSGKLYVLDRGVAATIPLDAIRSWEWEIASYTLGHKRSKQLAQINSGFFVRVEDLEKPVWQFMTDDKSTLERWSEILRQAKEGKI